MAASSMRFQTMIGAPKSLLPSASARHPSMPPVGGHQGLPALRTTSLPPLCATWRPQPPRAVAAAPSANAERLKRLRLTADVRLSGALAEPASPEAQQASAVDSSQVPFAHSIGFEAPGGPRAPGAAAEQWGVVVGRGAARSSKAARGGVKQAASEEEREGAIDVEAAARQRRDGAGREEEEGSAGPSVSAPPAPHLPGPSSFMRGLHPATPEALPARTTSRVLRCQWKTLMRWSRLLASRRRARRAQAALTSPGKVVVFGGGAFGTAMALALARKHPDTRVCLLLRSEADCRAINERHENVRYLPGVRLSLALSATTDAAAALRGSTLALHAVPAQATRSFLEGIRAHVPSTLPVVCLSKGLELATGQTMSDVVSQTLGRRHPAAFLSGPSFAVELAAGRPTAVVVASRSRALGRWLQWLLASPSLRVDVSRDVVGVELCGALKNVLAVGAGVAQGLDLGQNAMAAFVAQGCAEIAWLAGRMGAEPATVGGLAGLGDVMLSCYGSLSRNRALGLALGQGRTLQEAARDTGGVLAEGVPTSGVLLNLAQRHRVRLPVLTAIAQILQGGIRPRDAVAAIMQLPQVEHFVPGSATESPGPPRKEEERERAAA